MKASKAFEDGSSGCEARPALVDFIRFRMNELRLSYRLLEAATPQLSRSRLHDVLHPNADKRRAMRISESQEICAALGISEWEAAFGTELLESDKSVEEASRLAAFLATAFTGLAPRLATAIAGIYGLDLSDVRPEHGKQLQNLVTESFERGYLDYAERKRLRFKNDD